ncbi:hypothetical protein SMC26_28925 [Actinomadura fulvescens]|uniref:Aminoglycoside phosphotransferase n=1 Tax=Actinomadura fulvescens TaxID=46160 RepID=A0ABP6C9Z4_9ACTN
MALSRVDWEALPELVRWEVEKETGTVYTAETVSEGLNSAVAVILRTESGAVFMKGLRKDYPRRWTQDMEASINRAVRHFSARLLWRLRSEDWDLLGFEVVDGRHADYSPGSSDLAAVADTMSELGKVPSPDVQIKLAEDRWRKYVTVPEDVLLLQGDRLLHTDWNNVNVLMSRGRAYLIDWAWPTSGAGWIDPACWITRLMAVGHTADSAEGVVRNVPAWQAAPPEGLRVFASANARVWKEIADASSASWTLAMAQAAEAWCRHRTAE